MAVATYTFKRGNSLWNLADGKYDAPGNSYSSIIPGNNTNAKVNYLMCRNNIADARKIAVGTVIYLTNATASTTPSTPSAPSTTTNKVTITSFGLDCESTTGRDVFASWTWSKLNDHTKEFKIQWEWDYNGETKCQEETTPNTWASFTIPEEFRKTANWAQVFITPIAEQQKDSEGKDIGPYWTAEETGKTYYFRDNPPLKPNSPPSVSINTSTLVLTAEISNIVASELDAVSVIFNVVEDNTYSVFTSQPIPINTASNHVSTTFNVKSGHTYTVRACSVGANGKQSGWTEFSGSEGTKPSAPTNLTVRRDTHIDPNNGTKTYTAFLQWDKVTNATGYIIEYTNDKINFSANEGSLSTVTVNDNTPSKQISIDASSLGYTYYFRVKAKNAAGESAPSEIVELPVGSHPGSPSTSSTSNSVFVGEIMELHWIHNASDNSKQTSAQLSFNFNDEKDANGNFIWHNLEEMANKTTVNDAESVETAYQYGTAVSYKGTLYFVVNTNHPDLIDKKIRWRVRTAGVDNIAENDAWSIERVIYIYEKAGLKLSMSTDPSGEPLITTLTSLPFYIKGTISIDDSNVQQPTGYHVQIVSNDYYVTVDDVGRTKVINPGDAVYSKHHDTTANPLIVVMSADNVDLESGIDYTLSCTANMSTGLSVYNSHEFSVSWTDLEYTIGADISIDTNTYTAIIIPYCKDEDGKLVADVTLSVYRKASNGSYTEIVSDIPNNYTSVTDLYPSLNDASYRIVAKDKTTGALSFWDVTKRFSVTSSSSTGSSEIILQWSGENSPLKLQYNVKVNNKSNREVALVNYAGREHPVSYYGTQRNESCQLSTEIPKDDTNTIDALIRLSSWAGNVYVRGPFGMGYWANVIVSFSQSYDSLTIPITLDVTRVEGGS